MKQAIECFELYIESEKKHIKDMQDATNLPHVRTFARGNMEIINRMCNLDKYEDTLNKIQNDLKQCKCNKIKRFLFGGKKIKNTYRLMSPGIERKVVKIYQCECCNGYYSIVE